MATKTVSKKKPAKNKEQDFSKYIRRFWIIFTGWCFCIFLHVFISILGTLGRNARSHHSWKTLKTFLATEIISSDNETLGKFYLDDNRTPVDYEELTKKFG